MNFANVGHDWNSAVHVAKDFLGTEEGLSSLVSSRFLPGATSCVRQLLNAYLGDISVHETAVLIGFQKNPSHQPLLISHSLDERILTFSSFKGASLVLEVRKRAESPGHPRSREGNYLTAGVTEETPLWCRLAVDGPGGTLGLLPAPLGVRRAVAAVWKGQLGLCSWVFSHTAWVFLGLFLC